MASSSLLQSLAISDEVWTEISMDFIDRFPPSHSIFVIVDCITKYPFMFTFLSVHCF